MAFKKAGEEKWNQIGVIVGRRGACLCQRASCMPLSDSQRGGRALEVRIVRMGTRICSGA